MLNLCLTFFHFDIITVLLTVYFVLTDTLLSDK